MLQYIVLCFIQLVLANNFRNLDDSIMFPIRWSRYQGVPELLESPDYEKMTIISADQEEFQCLLPLKYGEVEDESKLYNGPGPLSLLLPELLLDDKMMCSYKMEAYWTYELCHGRHIMQYHSGSDISVPNHLTTKKKVDGQQYILGQMTNEQLKELAAEEETHPPKPKEIGETKVDSTNIPYYALMYTDGSVCALTEKPRMTRVLYVCFKNGRNEIYNVKETSTCQYDITVLSDVLCQHPLYRKREKPESPIHCLPKVAGARMPREMLRIESQSLKLKMMPETKLSTEKDGEGSSLGKVESDVMKITRLRRTDDDEDDKDDYDDEDLFDDGDRRKGLDGFKHVEFTLKPQGKDDSMVARFFRGEQCIEGGVDYWRYEFCYGQKVVQFHKFADGSRVSILLGTFDENKHIDFIQKHHQLKPSNFMVTHYYSDGAVCDTTGRPREVQVRFKCTKDNKGEKVTSVSLWLLEPEPCKYILGVETSMVCDLLVDANQFGLIKNSKLKYYSDTTEKTNKKLPEKKIGHWGRNGGNTHAEIKKTDEKLPEKKPEHWVQNGGNTHAEIKKTHKKLPEKKLGHWGQNGGNTHAEIKKTNKKLPEKKLGHWGQNGGNTHAEIKETDKKLPEKKPEHWGRNGGNTHAEIKKTDEKLPEKKLGHWGQNGGNTHAEIKKERNPNQVERKKQFAKP